MTGAPAVAHVRKAEARGGRGTRAGPAARRLARANGERDFKSSVGVPQWLRRDGGLTSQGAFRGS